MQHSSDALYRAEQIRTAERFAIEKLNMPGLQLMRLAGEAAFAELLRRWPVTESIVVLCGTGNNGGDGYVLARLAMQAGLKVCVQSVGETASLKGDALTSYQDFIALGGNVNVFDGTVGEGDVIVDAMLGTGLNRDVSYCHAQAIAAINGGDRPVLAVDMASGLHADTGCVMAAAVKADVTVTFIALKAGLFTGQAVDYCGEIVCATLDIPQSVFVGVEPVARLSSKTPLPKRARDAHKGHFGHVLLVGGNLGYSGAIRLAGEAALRSGAGLVSIATRVEHSSLINIGRPELMCHGVENSRQLSVLLDKASVIVIGPGLGQDDWAQQLFKAVVANDKPCVIDADALNLLSQSPCKRANWILTPHPGEAARLLGCFTQDVAKDRYTAASKLQARFGGVCVLKGAGSLIADSESIHVCTTGNPGMACGGMGDVLAGLSGALLAQGLSLFEAAKLAVYVHGEAADLLAAESGERGMLASDLLTKFKRLLN